jgi:hypothetical protein
MSHKVLKDHAFVFCQSFQKVQSMASNAPDFASIDVTFLAIGDDERIHHLNRLSKRRLDGRKRLVGNYYCIGLKLGQANEERRAVRIASTFLQNHHSAIAC